MTETHRRARRPATGWAGSTARLCVLAILVTLNVGGGAASAYWSADSVVGGSGLAAPAGTVNPGNPPTATAAKNAVTVNWTASTLSNGDAVSGYVVKRFAAGSDVQAAVLAGCAGRIASLACTEIGVPEGRWVYSVTPKLATNWTGLESPRSTPVASDAIPPINAITLLGVTGGSFKAGGTVYYRGIDQGSLKLINAPIDAGSGPASSATGSLTGGQPGPTHTATTVSTPIGGPFVSGSFNWLAGSSVTQGVTVSGRDLAGNTTANTLSLINDSTPPRSGTLTYLNGFTTQRSLSVTFTTGTDSGSGVGTRQLQRDTAVFTDGLCVEWTGWAATGATNPVSPVIEKVDPGRCYRYRYVVSDNVGNQTTASGTDVVKVRTYFQAVTATDGLHSYWRLGERAHLVADDFAGDLGTTLGAWTGGGMTWTKDPANGTEAVIANQRIRRDGTDGVMYHSSLEPVSADYTVAAEVIVEGNPVRGDQIGIVGRFDPILQTYYAAVYDQGHVNGNDKDSCWTLKMVVDNRLEESSKVCGWPLGAGSHRLELVMAGATITLRVDDGPVVWSESGWGEIKGLGRAGLLVDYTRNNGGTPNDANGLRLDNFTMTPQKPTLVDSWGRNYGAYLNGPTLGALGVTPGDTAATFDGKDDYGRVAREISKDFSIEFWFTSTQTTGTGQSQGTGSQWWQGAGLVDAEVDGAKSDFGVSLFSDGRVVAGVGHDPSDVSILSGTGYNDGKWHHVVFTRKQSTGAMALYVDGAARGTAKGDTGPLTDSEFLTFGRIQTGTHYFTGSLDEIAVYDEVLTPETVQAHYVPVP